MSATMPQLPAAVRTFTQQVSSTRRGARLARLLTYEQLRARDASPEVTDRSEQIVAELAANAALHGRDFRLALTHNPVVGLLRIAVTDARGDQPPSPLTDFAASPHEESGRGLLIVAALADHWGTEPCSSRCRYRTSTKSRRSCLPFCLYRGWTCTYFCSFSQAASARPMYRWSALASFVETRWQVPEATCAKWHFLSRYLRADSFLPQPPRSVPQ
ncbi:ATP-binding protein [Streptomyces sp. QTS137]